MTRHNRVQINRILLLKKGPSTQRKPSFGVSHLHLAQENQQKGQAQVPQTLHGGPSLRKGAHGVDVAQVPTKKSDANAYWKVVNNLTTIGKTCKTFHNLA